MPDHAAVIPRPRVVAYVLKGYPRISELFIASEIWRLEQLGVTLRLFVCKAPDEDIRHRLVDCISAKPTYLPQTTSLRHSAFVPWLRANLGSFRGPVGRVARRHPRGLARSIAAAGAQSLRARSGWRPKSIYMKEWLLAVALVDHLDDARDVDHIHAHFAHGTTTVTWLAAIVNGLPYSFTGHAKDIYRESLNPAGLLARKAAAAEFVVTCTAANVDHLRAVAPTASMVLAYHGLNAEFEQLLATAPDRARPHHLRIASVGRLVSKKGFDTLLRAVAEVHRCGIDVELLIAGESGDQAATLTALSAHLGIADVVTFLGTITQVELLALYRRSSVFALSCRVDDTGDRDGIPNVLVEAMAAGLPVVSTAISGIPELVTNEVNGLLVDADDVMALADALRRIAKDPELADELAAAGQRTIHDHFDGARHAALLAERFWVRR